MNLKVWIDKRKKKLAEEDSWWSPSSSLNPSMIGILELVRALDPLYKKPSPLSSRYLVPSSRSTVDEIMGFRGFFLLVIFGELPLIHQQIQGIDLSFFFLFSSSATKFLGDWTSLILFLLFLPYRTDCHHGRWSTSKFSKAIEGPLLSEVATCCGLPLWEVVSLKVFLSLFQRRRKRRQEEKEEKKDKNQNKRKKKRESFSLFSLSSFYLFSQLVFLSTFFRIFSLFMDFSLSRILWTSRGFLDQLVNPRRDPRPIIFECFSIIFSVLNRI